MDLRPTAVQSEQNEGLMNRKENCLGKYEFSYIPIRKEHKKMTTNVYQEQATHLRAKMAELAAIRRDKDVLQIETAADPFDQIQASTERDLLVGLLNHDAQLRENLRRALHLMENGAYGICEDCRDAISPARLKAIPWAHCCVRCQELRDREVNESDIFHEAA
jgi:DnaK suppressor protein